MEEFILRSFRATTDSHHEWIYMVDRHNQRRIWAGDFTNDDNPMVLKWIDNRTKWVRTSKRFSKLVRLAVSPL